MSFRMGSIGSVKTTIDINDNLLLRAKQIAKKTGRPLRAVVEDSLRIMLETAEKPPKYELADYSVGDLDGEDPLQHISRQDPRSQIYREPESR